MAKRSKQERLVRTYAILSVSVLCFVALETALFVSGAAEVIARRLQGVNWLLVLGAYMIVAYLASGAAHRLRSVTAQCAALATYVVAKALIFVPLLYWAERAVDGVVAWAAVFSVLGFLSLTVVVWLTGKDFSALRPLLVWGGLLALVAIVVALLTPFRLGVWFSALMILYAGAAILYKTDRVLRRYRSGREVAAALELFASIATMFWYSVRLLRQVRR